MKMVRTGRSDSLDKRIISTDCFAEDVSSHIKLCVRRGGGHDFFPPLYYFLFYFKEIMFLTLALYLPQLFSLHLLWPTSLTSQRAWLTHPLCPVGPRNFQSYAHPHKLFMMMAMIEISLINTVQSSIFLIKGFIFYKLMNI